jgi:two-component system nitrogen regulation sensor histidine kinase NtrY
MKYFEWYRRPPEERRRIIEVVLMVVVTIILVALSRLETRLLELSQNLSSNQDFFTSIIFFGQINFNVILILVLSGLLFRNVARLVVERRRGVIGSQLKTKLVLSLVFFAMAPTVLMFYVSYRFITSSFDTWFSSKVQETIQQTREAGAQVYRQDQRRVESLARIALQKVRIQSYEPMYPGELRRPSGKGLEGFESEYRLDELKIYDRAGRLIWRNGEDVAAEKSEWSLGEINTESTELILPGVSSAIQRFVDEPAMVQKGMVENQDKQDVVRGIAPIYDGASLIGVIVAEEHFETQILRSIESILSKFANLRPHAQLIRLSFVILLVAMLFLIIFSAIWLGFYVAKAITGPILRLAEAANEVAHGNYEVTLSDISDDETGQLMRQFNAMTRDLRKHKQVADESEQLLRLTNKELERRRHYMEIVLKSMSAGVISVDSTGVITSVSGAAKELLQLKSSDLIGQSIESGLGPSLIVEFWRPIVEQLKTHESLNTQVDLKLLGRNLSLLVDAARFSDEYGSDLGFVVVFDDATDRIRAQKVAAWREVARRIAHEIKNPITPIKLSAQRLLRKLDAKLESDDREVLVSSVETILNQVESLKLMVNEFSRFSRLPTVDTQPTDLNEVIKASVELYHNSYPEVVISTIDLSPELPLVDLDREQFGRVLVNLLSNAIDAFEVSQPDKKIIVSTSLSQSKQQVLITIADNGAGIPEKILDKISEPYFSTKKDGTGLGLPIVKQIISEHGGYFRINNQPGGGAVVTIELPIRQHISSGSSEVLG